MDIRYLRTWIGRSWEESSTADADCYRRLAALLDYVQPPWNVGEMPPLGHWLGFLPQDRQSELSHNGHAVLGGQMPPVPLPRRMWAGSRVEFHAAIPHCARMIRRSTVADVVAKRGKSGPIVFVTMHHEVAVGGQLVVTEDQDIVYRQPPAIVVTAQPESARTAPKPPTAATATRTLSLNAVQLFRFSALTFNSHRIHYDREYARLEEGYPGLVVHAPYVATLLIDHLHRNFNNARIADFSFRAVAPLFENQIIDLCLRAGTEGQVDLWTVRNDGQITMTARATLHEGD